MVTKKKNLPHSRVQLTLTGDAALFHHAFEHEVADAAKTLAVPGFRKGKAPVTKVIERMGRARFEAGAMQHMVNDLYIEAMQSEKLTPVDAPSIDLTEFKTPSDTTPADEVVITLQVEVDVIPEVDLSARKKLKMKKPAEPKLEEDELQRVLDYLRKQRASITEAPKDATLKNGMWVDLSYEGSVDGVKRADMANKNHPLVLGEGSLIPGFEEQIEGMKLGEERTIEVKFPKDYHATELAGKKAKFEVKVNEIKEVELPVLDDAFATNYGHDTLAELEAAIKLNLQEEKQEESRRKVEEEVLDELVKLAKFETPKSLIEQELERLFNESRERMAGMNFEWDMYLKQVNKTAEEVREEMRPQAERNVNIGLVLGKYIQEEGLGEEKEPGKVAIERLIDQAIK